MNDYYGFLSRAKREEFSQETDWKLPRGCLVTLQEHFKSSFRPCSRTGTAGAASHGVELSPHGNLHHFCSRILQCQCNEIVQNLGETMLPL